jgi:hypothetical protein
MKAPRRVLPSVWVDESQWRVITSRAVTEGMTLAELLKDLLGPFLNAGPNDVPIIMTFRRETWNAFLEFASSEPDPKDDTELAPEDMPDPDEVADPELEAVLYMIQAVVSAGNDFRAATLAAKMAKSEASKPA